MAKEDSADAGSRWISYFWGSNGCSGAGCSIAVRSWTSGSKTSRRPMAIPAINAPVTDRLRPPPTSERGGASPSAGSIRANHSASASSL